MLVLSIWSNTAMTYHQAHLNVSLHAHTFLFVNLAQTDILFHHFFLELKCLLNVKSQNKKMSETCLETLNSRQEMWKLAKISDSLTGINDLAQLINNSEHRSYLVLVLFAFTLVVFAFGCLCRRAVLGERRLYKNK